MEINILYCIIALCIAVSESFFFFADKEPIFLCFKICPLYCSPRRHDLDSSSLIYIDDEPPFHDHSYYYDDHGDIHSPHHGYYVFCKDEPKPTTPKPTTTTMATTTEEPTWICMMCRDKCNTKAKSKRK